MPYFAFFQKPKTKTMKNRLAYFGFIGLSIMMTISSVSCRKDGNDPVVSSNKMEDMKVSPNFKFATTQVVGIKVVTLDNANSPVSNVLIDIYTDLPDNGGSLIMSGLSDINGVFNADYKIPAGVDSLVVGTPTLGFCNMQKVKVTRGFLSLTLGGKNEPQKFKSGGEDIFKSTNSIFKPMGTYNSNGVPNYLATPNDVIDASMISDINTMLPEFVSSPVTHPQYFAAANEHNLVLTDACKVWVTFVSEGAAYKNVLGFYKYQTGHRPTSVSQIDSVHIIFPNASFSGSGGGLTSGNKVYLGEYAPGTEIGWVLLADGFRNATVTNGNWILYSDKNLNPEVAADKKQHSILLNDIGRGKFLLAFEDIRRDGNYGCDNDFNDAIFYVTADPVSAINTINIPIPSYTGTDTDGDGVVDNLDAYPTDVTKAFNNYYPSQNVFSTLAFEDLWPAKGDYDFNDMVVDYNFNQITNGQNKVVQIKLRAKLKALGASYKNGFGIQLPITPGLIASITGNDISQSFIVRNANGTEAGQSKATIIVFDNGFHQLPYPGGSSIGVNTTPGAIYVEPQELTVTINLTTPVALATMGLPPYNPFMIIDEDRTREVHLIDNPPTDLANMSLLGTGHDNSIPGSGRYYVTKNNLPFAIDISSTLDYPIEKAQVTQAHLKFLQWGESSGTQYYDWYKPMTGYRDVSRIYSH